MSRPRLLIGRRPPIFTWKASDGQVEFSSQLNLKMSRLERDWFTDRISNPTVMPTRPKTREAPSYIQIHLTIHSTPFRSALFRLQLIQIFIVKWSYHEEEFVSLKSGMFRIYGLLVYPDKLLNIFNLNQAALNGSQVAFWLPPGGWPVALEGG